MANSDFHNDTKQALMSTDGEGLSQMKSVFKPLSMALDLTKASFSMFPPEPVGKKELKKYSCQKRTS